MNPNTATDLLAWHTAYDDPRSPLGSRLAIVQSHLRRALASQPAGRIALLSICAGQGHDVIGVLADHPRAADVHAHLLDPDPRNCEQARAVVESEGLGNVEVARSDVWAPATYGNRDPVDIVLAVGLFGNVPERHLPPTIARLSGVCNPGATIIWSRHRRKPDAAPRIRACLHTHGFEEVEFETTDVFSVGTHRLAGKPPSLEDELADYVANRRLRAARLPAA